MHDYNELEIEVIYQKNRFTVHKITYNVTDLRHKVIRYTYYLDYPNVHQSQFKEISNIMYNAFGIINVV